LVLYYFSIAFNGVTWYEKHFNAYQQNETIQKAYRARVKELLYNETMKPSFLDFLRIAQPPMKYEEELKELYEKTTTYKDFFNSIPKEERCRLTREWLPTFMEHYLKGVFNNKNWVIDVKKMDGKQNNQSYGGTRKRGGAKRAIKQKYYCPLGKINLTTEKNDMGV
jgi:hypothetical protein